MSVREDEHLKRSLRSCGENVHISVQAAVISPQFISIGSDCAINEFAHLLGSGGITMGRGVWVANHASIVSVTHPSDVEFIGDYPHIEGHIFIEDHAWIGSHAVVLPGVRLGRSCIVGAGSVVTKDVPPYAIVTGVPAKVMRYKKVDAVLAGVENG